MRAQLVSTLSFCFAASLWAQDNPKLSPEEMHRLHQNSKAYIAFLDDPKRDEYQKPHEVIMALDLKAGERIAVIGAGSGYFAFRRISTFLSSRERPTLPSEADGRGICWKAGVRSQESELRRKTKGVTGRQAFLPILDSFRFSSDF